MDSNVNTATIEISEIPPTPVPVPPPVAEIPAEKTPVKPRKKRASKHDFKDGGGRVFARKHENGGGWVADTARVEASVYVGPKAAVYHFAQVRGRGRLEGRAQIYGHARLSDNVIVKNDAAVYGNAEVIGTIFLTDRVAVCGNAVLSGNTRVYDDIVVTERAQVVHSVLRGRGRVGGDAMVLSSNVTGNIEFADSAKALHATISGRVALQDFAHVLHSTISNPDNERPLLISDFCLVVERSHIATPLEMRGHIVIVRSHISCRDWRNFNTPVFDGTAVIAAQEMRENAIIAQTVLAINRTRDNPAASSGSNWTTIGAPVPQVRSAGALLPATGRRLIRAQPN